MSMKKGPLRVVLLQDESLLHGTSIWTSLVISFASNSGSFQSSLIVEGLFCCRRDRSPITHRAGQGNIET